MESKYAYARFNRKVDETEVTASGEVVQLNHPYAAGETNFMRASRFQQLQRDFPDCVEGNVIEQENLVNVINFLYAGLKEDFAGLSEADQFARVKMEALADLELGGVLKPNHDTESSIEDLANKFLIAQDQVREAQRNDPEFKKHQM